MRFLAIYFISALFFITACGGGEGGGTPGTGNNDGQPGELHGLGNNMEVLINRNTAKTSEISRLDLQGYAINAIAYDSSRDIYYLADSRFNLLLSYDEKTDEISEIAFINEAPLDLAFNSETGMLYALLNSESEFGSIWTINTATGVMTEIGVVSDGINNFKSIDISINSVTNELYILQLLSTEILVVNPENARLKNTIILDRTVGTSLAFDSDQSLFYTLVTNGNTGSSSFYNINIQGASTLIGDLGRGIRSEMSNIVFNVNNKQIYGLNDHSNRIYALTTNLLQRNVTKYGLTTDEIASIAYNRNDDTYFVVSNGSESIYKISLDGIVNTKLNIEEKYYPRSIAYDPVAKLLYATVYDKTIGFSGPAFSSIINPASGTVTLLENKALPRSALAFNTSDNILYNVQRRISGDQLYSIDKNTGEAVLIGDLGVSNVATGLVYNEITDKLYTYGTDDIFYELDLSMGGAATAVVNSSFRISTPVSIAPMAFDSTGRLLGVSGTYWVRANNLAGNSNEFIQRYGTKSPVYHAGTDELFGFSGGKIFQVDLRNLITRQLNLPIVNMGSPTAAESPNKFFSLFAGSGIVTRVDITTGESEVVLDTGLGRTPNRDLAYDKITTCCILYMYRTVDQRAC